MTHPRPNLPTPRTHRVRLETEIETNGTPGTGRSALLDQLIELLRLLIRLIAALAFLLVVLFALYLLARLSLGFA